MKLAIFAVFFLVFLGLLGEGIQLKVQSETGWWTGFVMKCLGKAAALGLLQPVMHIFKQLHGGSLGKDKTNE